mgnify:CR=1 FL=1
MEREQQSNKPSFVIVGAGPAGLVLGILLSRKGYPTAILERESRPHRQVCGEYLSPQGVAYLEALGLGRHLHGFRRLHGMKMSSPSGRQVLARFPERRFGLSINRHELTQRLTKEFLSLGGLLFHGESLVAVEVVADGFRVKASNLEYTCQALIGADGRASQAAKLLGLDRIPTKKPRVAIHAYLKPKLPLSPFGQMHVLRDGSYAGVNPISEKEVNFSVVADASLLVPVQDGQMRVTLLGYTQPVMDDAQLLEHHGAAVFLFEGISRTCTHQLVRHRLASFSQESQRYVDLSKGAWTPIVPPPFAQQPEARAVLDDFWALAEEKYAQLRELGVRKEDARFLLPNAAETRIVASMNYAAWSHFFWLRAVDKAAQWEIRAMGQHALRMLHAVAPQVFAAHWQAYEERFAG